MRNITGCLDLAALNAEIAEAYLKETEDELHAAVGKLESCLESLTELKEHEGFFPGKRYIQNS